jgi:exportin-1
MIFCLTHLQHEEIFKICCDIWNWFGQRLYDIRVRNPTFDQSSGLHGQLYLQAISNAREVLVPRMAKPTEVLVSSDDFGNAIREELNIAEVALYEVMREALIYFTHIDPEGMERLM